MVRPGLIFFEKASGGLTTFGVRFKNGSTYTKYLEGTLRLNMRNVAPENNRFFI